MAEVTISATDGGSFKAYLATSKGGKGPGILLIQEIFGVNKVMRDLAEGFAAQGYTVMCPDLFWRQEPGIDITDKQTEKAFGLFQGFNVDQGVDDLKATLASLRRHSACTGKAGAVGYCLGGKLAYLVATRSDSDASVGYYGVGIEALLDEAKSIRKPLLLHIAGKDGFCPPEAQARIQQGLKGHPQVTIHLYPEQDHAFARLGGDHYDKAAADLANKRTADFFKQHLG
jgi:carboxymethylenebutenolidase